MPTTLVTPQVHSADEHNIVAMPDGQSAPQIVAIQDQLRALLGDAIWLTPPQALHLTLMEIIRDTEYAGLSRQGHFAHWHQQYNDATTKVIAGFAPFTTTFNQLYISPAAIIIMVADPQPFNAIRAQLLATTTLPVGTKLPPEIGHRTLARFAKAIDLETARQVTASISVNVTEHVREFRLMKDLGPDFHPILEETYPLSLPETTW